MGAAEFTSSDHKPEDEAAEPEEPQTVDDADPAQFYSVRTEPVQSEPQSENPTDPLQGSAADDNLTRHAGPNRLLYSAKSSTEIKPSVTVKHTVRQDSTQLSTDVLVRYPETYGSEQELKCHSAKRILPLPTNSPGQGWQV